MSISSLSDHSQVLRDLTPAFLLILLAGIVDISLPLGVAAGVLYILPVLSTLPCQKPKVTRLVALIATLLIIVGYWASPEAGIVWKVLANRTLSILAVWITSMIVTRSIRTSSALEALHQRIDSEREQQAVLLEERHRAMLNLLEDFVLAQKKGEESEERFDLAIKGTNDGIWDWMDVNQDVQWWSPQFYHLLEYGPNEISASHSMIKQLLHPEDYERTFQAVQDHFEKHEPFDLEYRLRTKSGTYRWFRGRGNSVRDDRGLPLRMAGSIRDITDRKLAIERLRESEAQRLEALKQSDALKTALLSSVSHELRTPLTTMKASLSNLVGGNSCERKTGQGEFLNGIDQEIDYMSHLVSNLLDMSKIEAGRLLPHREWHPVEDLVEGALRRVGLALEARDIEIQIPDDLTPVFVDAFEMQQVLINLLDNAVKYSPVASVIGLDIQDGNQQIEVRVSNRGEPLGAQDLERIFERFYRCQSPRPQPIRGTGLGLAICKGIVEAHGGRIWAEAIDGKVVIAFTLPVTESMESFSLEGLHKTDRQL